MTEDEKRDELFDQNLENFESEKPDDINDLDQDADPGVIAGEQYFGSKFKSYKLLELGMDASHDDVENNEDKNDQDINNDNQNEMVEGDQNMNENFSENKDEVPVTDQTSIEPDENMISKNDDKKSNPDEVKNNEDSKNNEVDHNKEDDHNHEHEKAYKEVTPKYDQ